ncbi:MULTISPECIES: SHOCT domain-containing protein [Acidithiobacillus]|jgi:putative membrane protein|uniref:SHOCT domain-containing protein n=2 Tax=Acidithiobacillus TaxID=119977 RepID=A0A179BI50_ACIFR|nr:MULTISPECIES: SHOCT domain-containing protein [Acidithiobacillus]MDA8181278.1 SHOCT domain-containing protein [Acidithiobacillus sp.]MEB8486977.1 SHOCT domain-containing protein [Acidithiobacillus ferriphilus]MEB8491284.1 SHOCT domain-containing protein [Acidithiobacillus ferriphilus]MEB8494594.1 SHOCT domain-containing protein [Acidithiobacillus ferriphilus]MEB8512492.1 SHOCT domain-containing protein [Acidithiobacillus ferriphilus]
MWINGGWGWTPWMMIFPLFFLVLMVVFMVFMMRGGMGGGPMCGDSHKTPDSGETPREALDRRYARGEITREEYQQMRKDLE